MSRRIQAPRGTYDVLGEQALARDALEGHARTILERAGYQRIETPAFEATELFARGVGASTDVVQKEMYTLAAGDSESITLRPEGTAPVCRAYMEHGMHKLPQPVKLWYLGDYFRRERPQKGRFRQFWQIGIEAIGSDDPAVDAETIVLLAEILEAAGVRARLRISSLGMPLNRLRYRDKLQQYLRDNAARLSEEVVARIELNPLRAFDSDHPGTREVMAGAPRLLDELDRDDAEHFAAVRGLLDAADLPYEIDTTLVRGLDYYTRTVFEFDVGRPRRAVRRRRRRALRRADRGARRPADAGHRLGGRRRADPARRLARARGRAAARPVRRVRQAGAARGGLPPRRRRPPRRATRQDSNSAGARSRASSSRPTAPTPATLPSSATRAPR